MPRCSAVAASALVLLVLIPVVAADAQSPVSDTVALRAGWGAEAVLHGYADGSLLRIGKSGLAWVAGFSAQRYTLHVEEPGYPPQSNGLAAATVRLGARRYLGRGAVRPYFGLGGLAGRSTYGGDTRENMLGGYGEAGAIYLVTSHVSLGAGSQFSAVHERAETVGAFPRVTTQWVLSVPGVALRAAVYF